MVGPGGRGGCGCWLRAGVAAALVGALPWGCGPGPATAPARVVVRGRVERQKEPVPRVLVMFYAQEGSGQAPYTGGSEADGRFTVECPPGRYKVLVRPPPHGPGDAGPADGGGLAPAPGRDDGKGVPAKYRDVGSTPLTVEVPANGRNDVILEIK